MKQSLFTRSFILLLLGQMFSLIGNYTLKFALSMYVLELTGSAEIFGAGPGCCRSAHHTALAIGRHPGGSGESPLADGRVGCPFGSCSFPLHLFSAGGGREWQPSRACR